MHGCRRPFVRWHRRASPQFWRYTPSSTSFSETTPDKERALAEHPSLKPQRFLRHLVQAALPLGVGTVLDPFAGSGSTLAAAEALGIHGIGVEMDEHYFDIAQNALPLLSVIDAAPSLQEPLPGL